MVSKPCKKMLSMLVTDNLQDQTKENTLPHHYLTITSPSPHHYLTITSPSPHHQLTITSPSPHHHLITNSPLPHHLTTIFYLICHTILFPPLSLASVLLISIFPQGITFTFIPGSQQQCRGYPRQQVSSAQQQQRISLN